MDQKLRSELLEMALEARRRASEGLASGDRERYEKYSHVAAQLESTAGGLEDAGSRSPPLHNRPRKSMVNPMLTSDHRLAISRGSKPRGAAAKVDRFQEHIREKGFTQARLAAALDIDKGLVSKYRQKKGSGKSRPIPQFRADEVEKLTGWPADTAHWPGGIS